MEDELFHRPVHLSRYKCPENVDAGLLSNLLGDTASVCLLLQSWLYFSLQIRSCTSCAKHDTGLQILHSYGQTGKAFVSFIHLTWSTAGFTVATLSTSSI